MSKENKVTLIVFGGESGRGEETIEHAQTYVVSEHSEKEYIKIIQQLKETQIPDWVTEEEKEDWRSHEDHFSCVEKDENGIAFVYVDENDDFCKYLFVKQVD